MSKKSSRSPYLVSPGTRVRLERRPAGHTVGSKAGSVKILTQHTKKLSALQEKLYAQRTQSLLIVLQGMDTGGKDGTISHIFTGVNPQGCNINAFKVPNSTELAHDFLWRVHAVTPERGMIGIFNRSHYEDVLSPRVHGHIDTKTARDRMQAINHFEEELAENGTTVLKFFLHISHEEQTRRLQARLDDPAKHWKISPSDFAERRYWNDYQSAYEDIFRHTSTKVAPWYIIPADHKWYRNVAISQIIVQALEKMKPDYPTVKLNLAELKLD